MNFSGSPKGTPHDWCRRTMKKDYFAMKTNGIRWSSSKNDEYFHWGPIFYVCSSARNWVSSMYKGIYHIHNSLWGVATVDVWSSSTRTFQQKKTGPPKWSIPFYIVLTKWFFQAHRRVPPTTGAVEFWKKTILPWKPMELGGVHQKNNNIFTVDLYSMYVVLQRIGSLSCIRAL